ncbi:anti-sigma factor [Prevotella sp. HUN102]|uniref:anti-sigma factor family protein n=1 Tax=Prevotella sp. HUN102 TaxID=1392486 RepID=UPI000490A195|nr:hypothetical protein [Prevotella sp. HUN102]
MMKTEDIKDLLERFYEGNTTEEEERALKEYFSANDIAEELKPEQVFFRALNTDDATVPDRLEERLERQINQWNRVEKTVRRSATRISLRWIVGVAASLLILFSIGIFVSRQGKEDNLSSIEQADTYDNPEDASAEAARALTKFSKSLNKGLGTLEKITN